MVEREVTDIILASLATFILFMIVEISGEIVFDRLLIIFQIIIIFINFLHLIFRQLNRISINTSRYIVFANAILLVFSVVVFQFRNYDTLQFLVYNGIFLLLGYTVYLSRNATLVD